MAVDLLDLFVRKWLMLLIVGTALAGCATTAKHWTRRDGVSNPDQFARDHYRCVQESRVTWESPMWPSNKPFRECMDAAGYRPLTDEELEARGLRSPGLR